MLDTNTHYTTPGKHYTLFSNFLIVLLLLASCKPKEHITESSSMTVQSDTTSSLVAKVVNEEEPAPKANDIIKYNGATDDEARVSLETFSLFAPVHSLADRSIKLKDSIEMLRENQMLTNPDDSLIFRPYEVKAYQAILNYKKLMASGPALKDYCPSILKLNREPAANDSSSGYLPKVEASTFLAHGNFFFLGGAPFIYRQRTDDNTISTDPKGSPEMRFTSETTENGNYLLNSLYHFKNVPMDIAFGPPLDSYDNGPKEVNGIGSLIHTFRNRIPVFFLTENGLVPAHLIAVTLKLVPEYMGCVSDQPSFDFACSQSLDENKILGVYISYNSPTLTSCTINRPNSFLWTADLNEDGISDLACVSGTFEGISSDTMAESLWFVNINGVWKILDWAIDPDCT